ncbi:hypothetical protein MTR_3g048603 [Medicago truncatula]|uniref:Disease resistance protein At4g27190-like leucine-rich repeats domain-containing protein n=1 Tax=Medicago truncatula TaxID=3880 RepID=A0A072UVQ5_MEDTR|nr:hypothetical protein MTR_3g048603 [Medicago truncatula]
MCKIKVITLVNLPRIKSVFILSVASGMLLETLTVKSCDELKHIIVDIGDGSGNDNIVFPQLKELYVENCGKLEYIFGHIDDSDDHQNYNPHLPALKCLKLCRLPSLTGMCTKNYRTTFPPLAVLELINCTQFDIKSIGDFFVKRYLLV